MTSLPRKVANDLTRGPGQREFLPETCFLVNLPSGNLLFLRSSGTFFFPLTLPGLCLSILLPSSVLCVLVPKILSFFCVHLLLNPGLSRASSVITVSFYKWLPCLPLHPRAHFQMVSVVSNASLYVNRSNKTHCSSVSIFFPNAADCSIYSVIQGHPNIVTLSLDPNGVNSFPLEFWLLSCCSWGLWAVIQLMCAFWCCQILSDLLIR